VFIISLLLAKKKNCSYAHNGPAFSTWHRYYLLYFEFVWKQYLPPSTTVTGLTYLNWTNVNNINNILSPEYYGTSGSPSNGYRIVNGMFMDWTTLDENGVPSTNTITRTYTLENLLIINNWTTVERVASIPYYDQYPWEAPCSNESFVNNLEGFLQLKNGYCTFHAYMHNLFHLVIGGDMAVVPRATNDPIFYAHHVFLDLIFEMWMNRIPNVVYVPMFGAQPGHSGVDCIAPVFPCMSNSQAFRKANNFNYIYPALNQNTNTGTTLGITTILSIVFGTLFGGTVILLIIILVYKRSRGDYEPVN